MKYFLIIGCLVCASNLYSQQTVQEKLGYPRNTKLLIIHADDIGVSHSENAATIAALEKGSVSSGSIMVPCPWMPEIATYAKAHPNVDLGLHLTLTAEWKEYKWGPVLPRTEVPTLVDERGFFPDNSEAVGKNAKPSEVEKELRAQVERAKQFGIDPTHFDTHMGTTFATPELANIYVNLAKEYKVPILFPAMAKPIVKEADNLVITDNILMASPDDYKGGMKNFYTKVLRELQPGFNVLLLHAAHNDAEMMAVTVDHPDYGAAWRQADFEFFTSEDCKKLLKDNNIKVITWKEVRDKIVRK